MGEVIYGVVFGKPVTEDQNAPANIVILPAPRIERFSDDVQLPSDTEPPNESA